jgi:hypothetical protein
MLTKQHVEELRKLFCKTTPGMWSADTIQVRENRSAYRVMTNAKSQPIFDTLNSEVAEIHEDDDCYRWDETGRNDFAWIERVHNDFPAILRTITNLIEKVAELEVLRSDK